MGKIKYSGHVKLIASDIDGTFLGNDKQPSLENKKAVMEAAAAGIPFIFASGRSVWAIHGWIEELELKAPQVCDNGAQIYSPELKKELLRLRMPEELSLFVLDDAPRFDFWPVCFSDSMAFAEGKPAGAWMLERNNEPVHILSRADILKTLSGVNKMALVDWDRHDEVMAYGEHLKEECRKRGWKASILRSEYGILCIGNGKASKMNGIELVCRHLGCTLADVMALGDGDNDAEMLEGVGLGVAMGNATELAKQSACIQVEDNDHDGVAQAIRRYAIGGEMPH